MTEANTTILVLEDEAIIAFALEDMLVSDGAKVVLAATLEEADTLIDEGGIDSAVLDVNVHGEKSYRIGARLRALGVPFVFATGYGDPMHPAELDEMPMVSKPYSHAQIISALAEAQQRLANGARGQNRTMRGGENRRADL